MSMFKRVLAAALGVSLGVLAVKPVNAEPTKMPPGSIQEVVHAVMDAGFEPKGQDGQSCSRSLIMGYVNLERLEMAICFENINRYAAQHGLDKEQLAEETIKHEAFHVAQFCNGGPIAPELSEFNIDLAQGVTDWHILGYKPAVWAIEAEAHLAQYLEYSTITNYIKHYCQ